MKQIGPKKGSTLQAVFRKIKATACEIYFSHMFVEYAHIDNFQRIFRITKVGLSISVKMHGQKEV